MPRGRNSSRDIFPQLLLCRSAVQGQADTYTSATVPVPIPRFGGTSTRPYVFEVLKVFFNYAGVAAAATNVYQFQLSTVPFTAIALDTRVFVSHDFSYTAVATLVALTGFECGEIDLTDSNGHGLLVAVDNIYLGFLSTATASANNSVQVRILYRLGTCSSAEYAGIIQSQM